jgi:hypothetical protein
VDSVLKELMRYWRHFIETDIAKAYREEVTKFEKWLKETGLALLSLRARESAEKGNPVARDYPLEYIKGLSQAGTDEDSSEHVRRVSCLPGTRDTVLAN